MSRCPHCGSGAVASRRELFRALMKGGEPLAGFEWYDRSEPGALPPRSLFVQLSLLALLTVTPLVIATLGGIISTAVSYSVVTGVALMLMICLTVDWFATYRDYLDWAGESVCGDCGCVFPSDEAFTLIA